MAQLTTITVDYEHNCETWWEAARAECRTNPQPALAGLLRGGTTVTVSADDADEFLQWASGLPGWNERPFVITTH